MKLEFNSHFFPTYRLLSKRDQHLVDMAIELFMENPADPALRVHALTGDLQGYHSFSADEDIRILYTKKGDHIYVTLIKVGTHDTVYKTPIF